MNTTQTLQPLTPTLLAGDVELDLGTLIGGDADSFDAEVFGILDPDGEIDLDPDEDPYLLVWRIVDFTATTVILAVEINGVGL